MQKRSNWYFHYWTTALELLRTQSVVEKYLDVPLDQAITRTKWSSAWSTVLVYSAVLIGIPDARLWLNQHFYHVFHISLSILLGLIYASIGCLLCVLVYGFLRLYTLICHVMMINVYKSRGQRLRLLNVETTVLSLTAPTAVGVALLHVERIIACVILFIVALYAVLLLSHGFSVIFHKNRMQGFLLLLAATSTTWFILFIGALGVLVTIAVLTFLVLLILRIFIRK